MKYTRKLKIYYEFGIKPENDKKFEELIEFIDSIFINIKKYEILDEGFNKGNYIYKNDKNQEIFLYNLKNKHFYINYNLIWSVFITKFNCNYTDIQQLMKYLLFKTYKLKGITPLGESVKLVQILFKTYKLKGITPYRWWYTETSDCLKHIN